MSFFEYLTKVEGNFKPAIKVEWLNYDETVNCEFTNDLYDINASVNVNKKNGSRRTCTLTLNNDHNKLPISFNNIWFLQKFKLWMGIYLDNETPYYLPQGVFYVSNPSDLYNPSTRTVTINGVDKWAGLDGTLSGVLSGTYQTNVDVNLFDATRKLLKLSNGRPSAEYISTPFLLLNDDIYTYFIVKDYSDWNAFKYNASTGQFLSDAGTNAKSKITLVAKYDMNISFDYYYRVPYNSRADYFELIVNNETITFQTTSTSGYVEKHYQGNITHGTEITFEVESDGGSSPAAAYFNNIQVYDVPSFEPIDPTSPLLSPYYLTKTTEVNGEQKSVLDCPYTATVEKGKTYADVLLEYATILNANIYYDVHGRLVLEPMIDTADDITDTNKEILWDYTVDKKTFLGLNQTYNFDKVYNDFIVLGNVLNGYQFKGRVQNRNPMSNTCVQKIGLKTKPPIEDNQYVSDEQCIELAKYYAKTDTILQKSATIDSIVLYHFDVDKLVTISTPNNNMSKELFLVSGFSLSSSGTMSVTVTSVNVLKDFTVVEVDM